MEQQLENQTTMQSTNPGLPNANEQTSDLMVDMDLIDISNISSSEEEEEEEGEEAAVEGLICAACRSSNETQCLPNCNLAPYFPSTDDRRFRLVNTIFGEEQMRNIIAKARPGRRLECAGAMTFTARAWAMDSTLGCLSYVAELYKIVNSLQAENQRLTASQTRLQRQIQELKRAQEEMHELLRRNARPSCASTCTPSAAGATQTESSNRQSRRSRQASTQSAILPAMPVPTIDLDMDGRIKLQLNELRMGVPSK